MTEFDELAVPPERQEATGYRSDGLVERGVSRIIGAGGVETLLEVERDTAERELFGASVEHVRTPINQIQL